MHGVFSSHFPGVAFDVCFGQNPSALGPMIIFGVNSNLLHSRDANPSQKMMAMKRTPSSLLVVNSIATMHALSLVGDLRSPPQLEHQKTIRLPFS